MKGVKFQKKMFKNLGKIEKRVFLVKIVKAASGPFKPNMLTCY